MEEFYWVFLFNVLTEKYFSVSSCKDTFDSIELEYLSTSCKEVERRLGPTLI